MSQPLDLVAPTVLDLAADAGLRVLAVGAWPLADDGELPNLAGFIESSFSPLVAQTAERCLRARYGAPPADPARGERTALVLASTSGDVTTAVRVARAVDDGARVGPLLFFQSVPNAVLGHVAARWELTGPLLSLASTRDAFPATALLIADGDADEALVILAEQDRDDPGRDRAVAVLVQPVATSAAAVDGDPVPAGLDLLAATPPTATEPPYAVPTGPVAAAAEPDFAAPVTPAGPMTSTELMTPAEPAELVVPAPPDEPDEPAAVEVPDPVNRPGGDEK